MYNQVLPGVWQKLLVLPQTLPSAKAHCFYTLASASEPYVQSSADNNTVVHAFSVLTACPTH